MRTAFVASGQNATDAFADGDTVRVYDPVNWMDRTGTRTIAGISGAVVGLSSDAGISPGDIVLHADWFDWNAPASAAASVCAFRADTTATLTDAGPTTVPAHEHA